MSHTAPAVAMKVLLYMHIDVEVWEVLQVLRVSQHELGYRLPSPSPFDYGLFVLILTNIETR